MKYKPFYHHAYIIQVIKVRADLFTYGRIDYQKITSTPCSFNS